MSETLIQHWQSYLHTDEELRTLKKKKAQFIDLKKRYNNEQFGGFGQYVTDEQFDVTWDENDMIQVMEDDWVSSIIGTEEEAFTQVLAEINNTQDRYKVAQTKPKAKNGFYHSKRLLYWTRQCAAYY